MTGLTGNVFIAALGIMTLGLPGYGSIVTLASSSATPGATVSLPITFAAQGASTSGLAWTLSVPAADFSSVRINAGPALTQAGKQVVCQQAAFGGAFNCVVFGLNNTAITDGVIATAELTVSPSVASPVSRVAIEQTGAVDPAADPLPLSGSSANIEIILPTVLQSLSCAPSAIAVGSSAVCTVSLSAAAPAGGSAISLGYTSAQAFGVGMPASVSIPTGSQTASFDVSVQSGAVASTLTIVATLSETSRSASVSVTVPPPASVSISPAAASLTVSQTHTFTATISGLTNKSVTWSLSPGMGTISNGIYTAPAAIASGQTVIVRATSVADPAKYGMASVTLTPPAPVDIAPPVISSAASTPGSVSAAVSWATNEPATAKVIYGTSESSLTLSAVSSSLASSASLNLTGLLPDTAYSYRVVATDAAGNSATWPAATAAPASFRTAAISAPSPVSTLTMWPDQAKPQKMDDGDTQAVELGLKFSSDVAGKVTGLRFYKGTSSNNGVHKGTLWSSTKQKLATVTFTAETATGWQTAYFPTPVTITANATYVISYYAPKGRYSVTEQALTKGADSGPLHVPAAGGVYKYGGGFPANTYNGSNYWVDVLFEPK